MAEKMDAYFAVFNNHVNNAHDRAMAVLDVESPDAAEEIRRWKSTGIMAIFQQDPTPATKRYVELVTEYVNEDK